MRPPFSKIQYLMEGKDRKRVSIVLTRMPLAHVIVMPFVAISSNKLRVCWLTSPTLPLDDASSLTIRASLSAQVLRVRSQTCGSWCAACEVCAAGKYCAPPGLPSSSLGGCSGSDCPTYANGISTSECNSQWCSEFVSAINIGLVELNVLPKAALKSLHEDAFLKRNGHEGKLWRLPGDKTFEQIHTEARESAASVIDRVLRAEQSLQGAQHEILTSDWREFDRNVNVPYTKEWSPTMVNALMDLLFPNHTILGFADKDGKSIGDKQTMEFMLNINPLPDTAVKIMIQGNPQKRAPPIQDIAETAKNSFQDKKLRLEAVGALHVDTETVLRELQTSYEVLCIGGSQVMSQFLYSGEFENIFGEFVAMVFVLCQSPWLRAWPSAHGAPWRTIGPI